MTDLRLQTKKTPRKESPTAFFDLVVYDVECTMELSKKYTTVSVLANLAHVMEGWCSEQRSPCKFSFCFYADLGIQ